eukprot:TRINITY_DN93223_c0_g1_i1.p1 TRINITY_DN93223_c0_g1~~TRINITY_DN93223_c0_g1_i1.p1  ORF type:complete len:131 (-),score=19.20 TRINITY_DN93223_c0_g1_i1:133-525(-)
MARRTRTSTLSVLLVCAALCIATHLFGPSFVQQPKAASTGNFESIAGPATLGAVASLAGSMPAEALVGPLTGSEICRSKPLVYFIYPLCDPIFLVSPIYCAPLALIFFATLVTVINLAIPATQPDEDLRV